MVRGVGATEWQTVIFLANQYPEPKNTLLKWLKVYTENTQPVQTIQQYRRCQSHVSQAPNPTFLELVLIGFRIGFQGFGSAFQTRMLAL